MFVQRKININPSKVACFHLPRFEFRAESLSNNYVRKFPIIYSHGTGKQLLCFLVLQKLARNRWTPGVSEKSERAAARRRRVYPCYATCFRTMCLIFLSSFLFRFTTYKIVTWRLHQSLLCLFYGDTWKRRIRRYLHIRTTFYSDIRGNPRVASGASHYTYAPIATLCYRAISSRYYFRYLPDFTR